MWRTHNHFVVLLSHTHTKVKEDGRKFLEVIFVALIVVMVSLICLPSMLLSHLVLSDSATPWTAARQASLFFTISWSFLKLLSIESVMPSNHLILCCPFSSCLQTFPATGIEKSYESALCIRWPEYWSFTFSISPFNECSGLISFRIDWFELLPVQGTLKSVLQHHNWKHQFFGAQPYLWSNSHICTLLL